jgi:hypothetical protein
MLLTNLKTHPSGHAVFCLAILAISLSSSGCSDQRPQRVKISGQVLLDGQPLKQGTVQVYPQTGRPAYGRIDPQGRFTLGTFSLDDGCPVGTHRVAVVAKDMLGPNKIRWLTPKKYALPETSGLTISAEQDQQDYVLELTGDEGKPFTPWIEVTADE